MENPKLGPARGRLHKLMLAEAPPHPDLLPARGEKETAVRRGHVRSKRQSGNTSSGRCTGPCQKERLMADEKPDVLLLGPPRPVFLDGLAAAFTVRRLPESDAEATLAAL